MCTFTRGPSVSKNINGKMTEFNLLVKEFYVLQAFGNVTNGKCIYKCFSSLFTEQKSLMTRNVIKRDGLALKLNSLKKLLPQFIASEIRPSLEFSGAVVGVLL